MPDYVLHYCNSAEDYTRMFEVPCGSCMVLSPHGFGHHLWAKIKEEHNLYPSAWYHYTPHSMGAWLEEDGEPVARCMLYRFDLDKDVWPYFGDIKFVNTEHGRRLLKMMLAENKTLLPAHMLMPTPQKFTVPGIDSGDVVEGVVSPLPHCDAQAKDFSVTYDADTETFTFWPDRDAPKEAFKIRMTYSHDGYLRAEEVTRKQNRKATW